VAEVVGTRRTAVATATGLVLAVALSVGCAETPGVCATDGLGLGATEGASAGAATGVVVPDALGVASATVWVGMALAVGSSVGVSVAVRGVEPEVAAALMDSIATDVGLTATGVGLACTRLVRVACAASVARTASETDLRGVLRRPDLGICGPTGMARADTLDHRL
jgi:hypothetical protein